MSAAGASFPPETFHELVGRLALPLWGLTALAPTSHVVAGKPQR
ncbi:MAG TPA: hypothetical protein VN748_04665 [Pseudonocardiaceae bacterium]|jgi:hypothetical protein|nr:hypothetical protein [Pseudonocardiaceae bacterium]